MMQATLDMALCRVDITDAGPCTLDLIDGTRLPFICDPAGLIEAFDFALSDGAVVRQERRLVEIIPGLSRLDRRKPSFWAATDETRNRDKLLFLAMWHGMAERDRASFLKNIVGVSDQWRVAA